MAKVNNRILLRDLKEKAISEYLKCAKAHHSYEQGRADALKELLVFIEEQTDTHEFRNTLSALEELKNEQSTRST